MQSLSVKIHVIELKSATTAHPPTFPSPFPLLPCLCCCSFGRSPDTEVNNDAA